MIIFTMIHTKEIRKMNLFLSFYRLYTFLNHGYFMNDLADVMYYFIGIRSQYFKI